MMTVRTLKEGVCVKMTVKRRLFLSNILMIVVPAVIACLAAVVCFGLALLILFDSGLKVEGGEDLREMGHMVSKRFQELVIEHPDTWREQTGELASLIDPRFLRIVVEQDGIQSYSAGAAHASDGGLFQAALSVQGPEVLVSAGERSVYLFRLEEGGASWTLSPVRHPLQSLLGGQEGSGGAGGAGPAVRGVPDRGDDQPFPHPVRDPQDRKAAGSVE